MSPLCTRPNFAQPGGDELYAELIDAMRDMDEREALAFSARLVLLLMNHIGDPAVLRKAVQVARRAGAVA
jgi:hypothetical protein